MAASSSGITNITRTKGTRIGMCVLAVILMCQDGTIARHAPRDAAGTDIRRATTEPITKNTLMLGTSHARRRSTKLNFPNLDINGTNDC